MPERSRSPQGPRHLAPGGELRPWWRSIDVRRLRVAIGFSCLAVPLLVLDNLPEGPIGAEAVETVAPEQTGATELASESRPLPTTTSTTAAVTTTVAPPATAAPVITAPPTTAAPARTVVAPPTTAPTTAPPTTAPPSPPPSGSVEAIITAHFGPHAGDAIVIARCESRLNPRAHNVGGGYYGLFQLSDSHSAAFARVTGRPFAEAWFDANANTQYARWLFGQSGWSAWGCRHQL